MASTQRLALLREFEKPSHLSVHQLIAHLYDGVDWVLVEGFKHSDLQKIEVWRTDVTQAPQYPEDPFIVALATDASNQLPEATLRPLLDLNDAPALADWLLGQGERFAYNPEVYLE